MNKEKFLARFKELAAKANRIPPAEERTLRRFVCKACDRHRVRILPNGVRELRCLECKTCGGNGRPILFGAKISQFNCSLGKWDELYDDKDERGNSGSE